jgi:threonine aldolase
VENTHNIAGGVVYDRPHLERLLDVGRRYELPVHLDGARIFNAAVALGTSAAAVAQGFDSVMFCLSKGLGAPVGSMLCGPRDFIREGRRVRKMFGGGMRQAGVIAAAGLIALRKGPGRLAEDHENARRLALALAELPGVEIDPASVQTNILVCRIREEQGWSAGFLARLQENGVLASQVSAEQVRFVTHRDVTGPRIEEAIERIRTIAGRVTAQA